MPTFSPRAYLELGLSILMLGFIGILMFTNMSLRVKLADSKVQVQTDQLKIQSAQASDKSCQLALASSSRATEALASSTRVAWSQVDLALQRGQDRSAKAASDISRLLSVRAAPGQDCQVATVLARAAWGEHQ